jgi:hypothetical protein
MTQTLETSPRRTVLTGPTPVRLAPPVAVPADAPAPDTVACPECGRDAVVEWRDLVDSTDGPVEHVKVRCPGRHWFLMPAEALEA